VIVILLLAISGCATRVPKDYTKFNAANLRSILIVPVVNRSVEVTAPDYFLSTISVPVAEHGYYVFPVNMVKRVLEDDGLSDADLVHNADPCKLCNLFGADSVLYVCIEKWDAKYAVLTTAVTVDLTYVLKDSKTGDMLWNHRQRIVYQPQQSSSGNPFANLIAMAVTAAITKASPNYVPLARKANAMTFAYPGPGFPPGPYSKEYEKRVDEEFQ